MGRAAQPEEIAPADVFLAAPVCSGYISGIVLPITGSVGAVYVAVRPAPDRSGRRARRRLDRGPATGGVAAAAARHAERALVGRQRHAPVEPGAHAFNAAKGRCETCEGEGFVSVELLFMPSVYTPCPTCHGARFNESTLKLQLRGASVADVLNMTVHEARGFFAADPPVQRPLALLEDTGLGQLRLAQAATELSGGDAQRLKLATELQPAQLRHLVDAGNTVIVVEHHRQVPSPSPGSGEPTRPHGERLKPAATLSCCFCAAARCSVRAVLQPAARTSDNASLRPLLNSSFDSPPDEGIPHERTRCL